MKQGSKHIQETKDKIAKSMSGNFNAEKWTEELVTDTLNAMWDYCCEDYEVEIKKKNEDGVKGEYSISKTVTEKVKRKNHLKGKLLIVFGIKNAKWFSEMAVKFEKDKTVSNLLGCISMICEVNTYEDAANGVTNVAVAKMNLSTHYNWADNNKSEVDMKNGLSINLNLPEPDEFTMKKWEDSQIKPED